MMNLLYILLLVLWSAFNSSDAWYHYYHTTTDPPPHAWYTADTPSVTDSTHTWQTTTTNSVTDSPDVWQTTTNTDVPVPNITVYRQKENREHVIVLCEVDMTFHMFYWQSFTLSVESEEKYTMKRVTWSPFTETCVFMVTVSPPASFTCEIEAYFEGEVKNLSSQTYTYEWSVLDHHEEGVSLFYICFSSFIAVGLIIMTAAVIMTTIRSKAKDSINHTTTVTDNDYMDA